MQHIFNLPFFFILGRPRSGTTLLRSIFDAHPSVNIPPEHINLIHLYYKYRFKKGNWTHKELECFYHDFSEHNAIKTLWKLNDESIKTQLYKLEGQTASFEQLIKLIYYNYQSLYTKDRIQILGDKSPVNSLYAKKLVKVFPSARFIHLVRDYRGNLSSMLRYEVFSPSVTTIVSQWKYSVNQIEQLATNYPDKFITIRYEDLVKDPQGVITRMCSFLNINFNPVMLDSQKREEIIKQSYDQSFISEWHPNLPMEISENNIDKWKQKLSPSAIRLADYIAGKTGEKYYYTRIYSRFAPGFRFISIMKILAFYNREIHRHLFDNLPYKWKAKIRNRRFILSKEIIIFYHRIIGRK